MELTPASGSRIHLCVFEVPGWEWAGQALANCTHPVAITRLLRYPAIFNVK